MTDPLKLDTIYAPSDNLVVREVEGELMIVLVSAGPGDMEDKLFTLNHTGKAIWDKLDGTRSLRLIVRELVEEYNEPTTDIERAVTGLVSKLVRRKMVIVQ